MERDHPVREHERFEELCALSTSGELSSSEMEELQEHLVNCTDCRQAVADCEDLAQKGMPYLAGEFAETAAVARGNWTEAKAKQELFSRLKSIDQPSAPTAPPIATHARFLPLPWALSLGLSAALMIFAGLSVVLAYRVGMARGKGQGAPTVARSTSLQDQLKSLNGEKASLGERLEQSSKRVDELVARATQQSDELNRMKALEKEHQAREGSLVAENEQQSLEVSSLSKERNALSAKLQQAEASLRNVETELDSTRRERQADLVHYASLEADVSDLSRRLADSDKLTKDQQNYLASDRDIRELMGARELYIADVFDVDGQGTKKPFGRVFYTKEKSLIFYAFDLDEQRHLRNASVFQAWGRQGINDKRPLNLGIFYLDNQANRRWVLKFDDPKVLAQIDAVFVTIEPSGGNQKPSGKQLLFASLRNMSNHP